MSIRNQKGISLLEVLASLTLLTVVLGMAFLLFGSVNQLFNHTALDYTDKNDLRTTMNTISDQMIDAVAVHLYNGSELRFMTIDNNLNKQFRAIVYSSTEQSISLYSSTDATENLSSGTYTLSRILAENVEPDTAASIPAFSISKYTGTSPSWIDLTIGDTLTDGAMIRISTNFALTQIGASSQNTVKYKQLEAVIPIAKKNIK